MIKTLVSIDEELRTVLSRIEHVLSVQFDASEIARVFSDSADDQISVKRYTFHQSSRVSVTGIVDDYESETLWLCVEGSESVVSACAGLLGD